MIVELSHELKREDFFVELIQHSKNKIKWGKHNLKFRGEEEQYIKKEKEKIQFCNEALEALATYTAEKPIKKIYDEDATYCKYACPTCNSSISPISEEEKSYQNRYCHKCGQALDWGDEK